MKERTGEMAQYERITVSTSHERPVIAAAGHVAEAASAELAATLQRVDPDQYPSVTVDLRGALSLDPLGVRGLLQLRERWSQKTGGVRLIVSPGPIHRYLENLGLGPVLDVAGAEVSREGRPVELDAADWAVAQRGAIDQYDRLLHAVHQRDLRVFRRLARTATPVCVAAGAGPGCTAFGDWCAECPVGQQFGCCRPIVSHMLRSAEDGNWEAAEALVMDLIKEVAGMPHPGGGGQ